MVYWGPTGLDRSRTQGLASSDPESAELWPIARAGGPQREKDGDGHGREVALRVRPGAAQDAQIHEARDRDDDGGRERGLREEYEKLRKRQRRHEETDGREGSCDQCHGARIEDDRRARESAGNGHAP